MNIKKYITFRNGFFLMCVLWIVSNCSGNRLSRQVHNHEVVVEKQNIIIDSLQKEVNICNLRNDTLSLENRMLKESIKEYKSNYSILVKSNADQARTIRNQTEIEHE